MYYFANTCLFWTAGNYFIGKDGALSDIKLFSLNSLKNTMSPPVISVFIAVIVILLGVHLPDFITSTAKYLGGMTTALSLIFIGVVMVSINLKDVRFTNDVIAILAGRFLISPLLVIAVAVFIPIPDLMKKVFVIQSALPAMTQITLIAKQYETDTEYAALLTAITTVAAIISIPAYMVLV
jgi:hypothetical protein